MMNNFPIGDMHLRVVLAKNCRPTNDNPYRRGQNMGHNRGQEFGHNRGPSSGHNRGQHMSPNRGSDMSPSRRSDSHTDRRNGSSTVQYSDTFSIRKDVLNGVQVIFSVLQSFFRSI